MSIDLHGDLPFDPDCTEDGYRFRRARLTTPLGFSQIGASVYELGPGERTWPYHWHHANDEAALVLTGRVVVRTPDGERELGAGSLVGFPRGRAGSHILRNDSDAPARVLMFASSHLPDMTEYPDSGKVGLFGTEPIGEADGWSQMWLPVGAEVDYWEGEKIVIRATQGEETVGAEG